MNTYFSTFFTGFSDVIEKALKEKLKDIDIILLCDGLVVYETDAPIGMLRDLNFLNNSFHLLLKENDSLLDGLLSKLSSNEVLASVKTRLPRRPFTFRIRAAEKNQYQHVDRTTLSRLEERIMDVVPNLTVDRSLPELEFLVQVRSDGLGLIGIQFTKRPNYEKELKKGELYPELAYLLCLISDPGTDDTFLDPFAGYGSIPAARLKFPYTKIIACEIDPNLQRELEKRFGDKVRVQALNALSLSTITDGSIDKIITDPPWGFYEKIDARGFYPEMLNSFYRVLKPKGTLVILTAQKELMEKLISKYSDQFNLENTYTTLVSGRKASVYKLVKH